MSEPTTWGLGATIKAPTEEVLEFVAFHLNAGAKRIYVFLDDANRTTHRILKKTPKVRSILCNDAWWAERGGRPDQHRTRQSINANYAYAKLSKRGIDWFSHIDVDEFIWPDSGEAIHQVLASQPETVKTLRLRPFEMLQGDGTGFKAPIPWNKGEGRTVADRVYPQYGRFLKGGFVSHIAGKVIVRTGLPKLRVRIHNVLQEGAENPGQITDERLILCHAHARDWDQFKTHFKYRLEHGSYRAELPAWDGVSRHEFFKAIATELGDDGLRAFYEEICLDTPELRQSLDAEGLLRVCELRLGEARTQYFGPVDPKS